MADVINTAWWRLPKGQDIGAAVIGAANAVCETTKGRQQRMYRSAKMYGGTGYVLGGRFASGVASGALSLGQQTGPTDNIIYSVISTMMSQILSLGIPRVTALTSKGNWLQQKQAKQLEAFLDGLMYQLHFSDEAARVLLDALWAGVGYMHYFLDADSNVRAERVFPSTVHVEAMDGRDQRPRTMYRIDFVDRDLLASRYPKFKKKIFDINAQMPAGFSDLKPFAANLIPFVEVWHLPTSSTSGDGRHVLVLNSDFVLVDEEYEQTDFPISALRFEDLPTGFDGLSVAELLRNHQRALSHCNAALYWAWSQVAAPRFFMRTGTLNKNQVLSSLSGMVLEGTQPPEVLNFAASHPDFVTYIQNVKESAFAMVGCSQMTASGVKPVGLNSGEAQRVYYDQGNQRLASITTKWKAFFVDAGEKLIALARQTYKTKGKLTVRVVGRGYIETIDWKDLANLDDQSFILRLYSTNALDKDPAGRIQNITEWSQAGVIDAAFTPALLDYPDLAEAMAVQLAQIDNAQRTAYLLLHEGKFSPPDNTQNLGLCTKLVTAELLRAVDNDGPEENIALARRWLAQCRAVLQPPPQQTQPGGPPGAGVPGGPPAGAIAQGAAAPVSSLMPFKTPRQ